MKPPGKIFSSRAKGGGRMPYYPPDQVARAREMDLLTYLQNYEPEMLVPCGPGVYCTKEHDSLKISNGKWCWFSRGIGGKSALDYLIKVKELPFLEAMAQITGQAAEKPPVFASKPAKEEAKKLLLPQASRCATPAITYLEGRGIDQELTTFCIQTGRLYESTPHHNVVFVGRDKAGTPRYAAIRGIYSDFKGEATGSDKRFSFHIPGKSQRLHLFESAIDLLSYATLLKMSGCDWRKDHLLSLAGIYQPKQDGSPGRLPLALKQYLEDYPEIHSIVLRLDNDFAGRKAASMLQSILAGTYQVQAIFPPKGKDYNDFLCIQKNIISPKQKKGREI